MSSRGVDRIRMLGALIAVLALAAVLASCGDDEEPSSAATGGGEEAPSAEWVAGGGAEWDEVLKAAQEEGEVIVAAYPPLPESSFAEDFERDTGIKLTYASGEVAQIQAKIAREAEANKLSIDVAVGGGAELLSLLPQGLLHPVAPQLLLPSVTDTENWNGGEIKWLDQEKEYLLQGSESSLGAWTVVNTDAVEVESLETWDDLLAPEYKGKISTYDAAVPGPGQALAAGFLGEFGEDFVRKLYGEQDLTPSDNRRQIVEWAARGTYPIGLGPSPVDIATFREQGLPVTSFEPSTGPQFLTGASSVLKQPQNKDGSAGPHPNAATVFINWYASQPGQVSYNKGMLDVSRRTDVPVQEGVPDAVVPDPDREHVDTYSYEYYVNARPKIIENLLKVLGG